jgi:flagellar protein FliL
LKETSEPAAALPKDKLPQEEVKRNSPKKTLLLLGGAGIILMGALVGTASYLGWIEVPGMSFAKKSAQAAPAPKPIDVGPMVKLSPLIINLNEAGGRNYLKMTLVLEIAKKDWVEDVQRRIPSLTDMVILTLGDKRLEELRKPEAKERLKKDLQQKANQIVAGEKIKEVYFDEFLFQ